MRIHPPLPLSDFFSHQSFPSEPPLTLHIAIIVTGIVQGVGFRPFVYRLAKQRDLRGFVENRSGTVFIEVEGLAQSVELFLSDLTSHPPKLAIIEEVRWEFQPPLKALNRPEPQRVGFTIETSEAQNPMAGRAPGIGADIATCDACLAELFDPQDRRYRYPFLNCTDCGPRLTLITNTPYERHHTTMSSFPLCKDCLSEYRDPKNRRFHAQPIACWKCGPTLKLLDLHGALIQTPDPLQSAVNLLLDGQIGALKDLGGYHLMCDARRSDTVKKLRLRKRREEKPLAILVADVAAARKLCTISAIEEKLLVSPQRPIVLLQKRSDFRLSTKTHTQLADEVSFQSPSLGIMLPSTPLHSLILRQLDGAPLVMTSGNSTEEPIAFNDEDALARLGGIADFFLTHNRPIQVCCDDSVVYEVNLSEPSTASPPNGVMIRRARGYAPHPIQLPVPCAWEILAVGGHLKNTFAMGIDRLAFLSHHLGDLSHYSSYSAFTKTIQHYQNLFAFNPQILAHDLHPDYASTRYVTDLKLNPNLDPNWKNLKSVQTLPIQHHHAHMASCMAENQLIGATLGIIFDGTGFGTDGSLWGGEFFLGDYHQFSRLGSLRSVPMPGGEKAIREPWRMAVSYLRDLQYSLACLQGRLSNLQLKITEQMIESRVNTPLTSSVGRLFDGVASLLGVCDRVTYEGQAAMELEGLALRAPPDGTYSFELQETETGSQMLNSQNLTPHMTIDTRPLIRDLLHEKLKGVSQPQIARRFHSTLAKIIVQVCGQMRRWSGVNQVVLTGGVFMNRILLRETYDSLVLEDFQVFIHRQVPPNDGGLSLGQLAIAAAKGELYVSGNSRPNSTGLS